MAIFSPIDASFISSFLGIGFFFIPAVEQKGVSSLNQMKYAANRLLDSSIMIHNYHAASHGFQ